MVRVKQAFDLHTSTFTQSVVAEILADAAFLDRHLARLRLRYAARRAALAGALAGDGVSFATPRGGLFLWVELRGVDTTALFDTAPRTTSCSCRDARSPSRKTGATTRRLSFATLPEPTLRACAEELRSLF